MKIAVYTIARNESAFLARWAQSCVDADVRLILDTGSTDDTVARARAFGVTVHETTVRPWRFDVARNESLARIPCDVDLCIALDADEVLQPGWRAALERVGPAVTRPRYRYVWSWLAPGVPGVTYYGDKIHTRHGYRWRLPVHETLEPIGREELEAVCEGLEIHHHPDDTKSRGSYFPLLQLAAAEAPDDDRTAFYLAREYSFRGETALAIAGFKRHLAMPSARWRPERMQSMRFLAQLEPAEAESWIMRACAESLGRREPWLDLARFHYARRQWLEGLAAAERGLSITSRHLEYLSEPGAWGPALHDLAAICAWQAGLHSRAHRHAVAALAHDPQDERLRRNIALCQIDSPPTDVGTTQEMT